MKSEYTDAEIWLAAALAAIGGLTTPAIGGSDQSITNVVDVAGRVADAHLVNFRTREATLDQPATDGTADDPEAETAKGGRKAKRAS